jgi:hypothetical protein
MTNTLLYTSSKTSNANTKLFLDSSFHDVDAKKPLEDVTSAFQPAPEVFS